MEAQLEGFEVPAPAEEPAAAESAPAEAAAPAFALPGVSDKTMRKLVEAGFDTAEKIAEATVDALSEVQGIGLKTAERIIGTARGEQVAEPAEAEAGAKTE